MNCEKKPWGIILAAGSSSRMRGENKLLKLWRGKPLLAAAAATVRDAKNAGLIAGAIGVTGRDSEKTAKLLSPAAEVIAHNPKYKSGIASSLHCALAELPRECPAVLVFLGDMPQVARADIAAVVQLWREENCAITVPAHKQKRGNPVLISARLFANLRALGGDTGARALFSENETREAEAGPGVLFDIDSPEELRGEKNK